MKIAISGKGGVGKTTLSAGLARLWADEGRHVIAIDADPDANLAMALGADRRADRRGCVPLSQMDDLIEERTGAAPGQGRHVPHQPRRLRRRRELRRGRQRRHPAARWGPSSAAASGCMCSEGIFLKAFMRHLLVKREDVAILDMEAGIEHLGRGTAESVDVFIVVVEPGARSVQTARQVTALAADIGVKDVVVVGNKVRDEDDAAFLRDVLRGHPRFLGILPDSEAVRRADREGRSSWGTDPEFTEALRSIAGALADRTA